MNARPQWKLQGMIAVALLGAGLCAAPAHAFDRDGDRMRARALTADKADEDSLDGQDKADWRYIEVTKEGQLTITVRPANAATRLRVRLTDGDGKELVEGSKLEGGAITLRFKAGVGVYYLQIALEDGEGKYSVQVAVKN